MATPYIPPNLNYRLDDLDRRLANLEDPEPQDGECDCESCQEEHLAVADILVDGLSQALTSLILIAREGPPAEAIAVSEILLNYHLALVERAAC